MPETFDEGAVLNIEDVPEEIADALAHPPQPIVQCAVCRRLCVRDEFVWKEKQLCAWDYHTQVFGKRGPWRNGGYEERRFETLPECAYVAPPLLVEMGVEVVLMINEVTEATAHGDDQRFARRRRGTSASGRSDGWRRIHGAARVTNRAIRRLATFFVVLFAVLVARQAYVQIVLAPSIAVKAGQSAPALLDANRGRILATDGTVLARTVDGQARLPARPGARAAVGYISVRYGPAGSRRPTIAPSRRRTRPAIR